MIGEPGEQPPPLSPPLSWGERSGAIPAMPGEGMASVDTLRRLMLLIAEGRTVDDEIGWPTPNDRAPLREILRRMGSCGLIQRRGNQDGTVRLTQACEDWLETDDVEVLIGTFHANIRLVGEILAELAAAPRSHNEMLEIANERYELGWSTLDQLRRRTVWLRAAGLVDLDFRNLLTVTPPGQALLARLSTYEPRPAGPSVDGAVDIAPPTPPVAGLVQSLDESALRERRSILGYIPVDGSEGAAVSLRLAVGAAIPSISRDEFFELCSRHFTSKQSSADSFLSTLRLTGLYTQIGPREFTATPAARSWIDEPSNLDLIRILHANILFVGELLDCIETRDRAPDLVGYLKEQYGVDRVDLPSIRTELRLLERAGLLTEVGWARYRITPMGRAFRDTIPRMSPIEESRPVEPVASDPTARAALEAISAELQAAATDSQNPTRLEAATAAAFQSLGLSAHHDGRSGRPDIVVQLSLGPNPDVAIVDAKASGLGEVPEKNIQWDTLREHAVDVGAQSVAVIGPSFRDDRLIRRSREHKVVLIDAVALADVVVRHGESPLSPAELRLIFESGGLAKLDEVLTSRRRQITLVSDVLSALVNEAEEDDSVLGGGLSPMVLYALLRRTITPAPSIDDIKAALQFLSSPLVRAVEEKSSQYFARERPEVTATRLRALADAALAMPDY